MAMRAYIHLLLLLTGIFIASPGRGQDFGTSPATPALQQRADSSSHKAFLKRFYFGGSLGAQFGNNTFAMASPLIGYKITNRLSIGTRITYEYIRVKYANLNYQNHVVGASLFTRFFVYKDLFAHVEYEILNGDWNDTGRRTNIPALFVGGGYLFRFGNNAGFGLSILFNVLPSSYLPYTNPVINGGFTMGL